MKFFISSIVTLGYWTIITNVVDSFSIYSSFTGGDRFATRTISRSFNSNLSLKNGGMLMYDTSRDPPNNPEQNAWAVIASTERWIADTLKTNNQIANSASSSSGGGNSQQSNPYARKEVSYYCETNKESPMIVAGIYRMLKEARERGEVHGADEELRCEKIGKFLSNILQYDLSVVLLLTVKSDRLVDTIISKNLLKY